MAKLSDALRSGGRNRTAYETKVRTCSMCGGTGGRPVTSGGVGEGKCLGCGGAGRGTWRQPKRTDVARAKPSLRSTRNRDKRPTPSGDDERVVPIRPAGISLDAYVALQELGWVRLIKHTDALHMAETPSLFDNGDTPDMASASKPLPRGGEHR